MRRRQANAIFQKWNASRTSKALLPPIMAKHLLTPVTCLSSRASVRHGVTLNMTADTTTKVEFAAEGIAQTRRKILHESEVELEKQKIGDAFRQTHPSDAKTGDQQRKIIQDNSSSSTNNNDSCDEKNSGGGLGGHFAKLLKDHGLPYVVWYLIIEEGLWLLLTLLLQFHLLPGGWDAETLWEWSKKTARQWRSIFSSPTASIDDHSSTVITTPLDGTASPAQSQHHSSWWTRLVANLAVAGAVLTPAMPAVAAISLATLPFFEATLWPVCLRVLPKKVLAKLQSPLSTTMAKPAPSNEVKKRGLAKFRK